MKKKIIKTQTGTYELLADHTAFWLNATTGESVARFGRLGIDVHRPIEEQLQGKGQCLACTHTPTGSEDWEQFTQICHREFGIQIPKDMRPAFLSQAASRQGRLP